MARWILLLALIVAPLGALEPHGEFRVGHVGKTSAAFTYVYLEFAQGPVTLYGSWRTQFEVDPPWGYPFSDTYEVGARLDWRGWFLDINHFCEHAVWSGQEDWGSLKGRNIDQTTISVGVRW